MMEKKITHATIACTFIRSSLESVIDHIDTIQRNLEAPILTEDSELQNILNLYGIIHMLASVSDEIEKLPNARMVLNIFHTLPKEDSKASQQ